MQVQNSAHRSKDEIRSGRVSSFGFFRLSPPSPNCIIVPLQLSVISRWTAWSKPRDERMVWLACCA